MGQVGSSKRIKHLPANDMLDKNCDCYFYNLSSHPDGFKYTKGLVIDHSYDKKTYTIASSNVIHKNVPHIYVSSTRKVRSWEDYFKPGTRVRSYVVNQNHDISPRESVISQVHRSDYRVDLLDVKTNHKCFSLTPRDFFLDVEYYRDW